MQNLQCPICYKYMGKSEISDKTEALTFNCGHTVCRKCYENMSRKILINNMKCPLCKETIQYYQSNFILNSILDNSILHLLPEDHIWDISAQFPILDTLENQVKYLFENQQTFQYFTQSYIFDNDSKFYSDSPEKYEIQQVQKQQEFMSIIQQQQNPLNLGIESQNNKELKDKNPIFWIIQEQNIPIQAKVISKNNKLRFIVFKNYFTQHYDNLLTYQLKRLDYYYTNIHCLNKTTVSKYYMKIDVKDAYNSIKRSLVIYLLEGLNNGSQISKIFKQLYQFGTLECYKKTFQIHEGIFIGYKSSRLLLALVIRQIIKKISYLIQYKAQIIYFMDDILVPLDAPNFDLKSEIEKIFEEFQLQLNQDKIQIVDLSTNKDEFEFVKIQFINLSKSEFSFSSNITFEYTTSTNGQMFGKIINQKENLQKIQYFDQMSEDESHIDRSMSD